MPNRRQSIASLTLSFGKYQGKPVASVPRSYLQWMLRAPGMPVGDIWIASQYLQLDQPQAHIDSAGKNRCVNDVMGTAGQLAEVSNGKPSARTLCSTQPLDEKKAAHLAGIVPTEAKRSLPQERRADG